MYPRKHGARQTGGSRFGGELRAPERKTRLFASDASMLSTSSRAPTTKTRGDPRLLALGLVLRSRAHRAARKRRDHPLACSGFVHEYLGFHVARRRNSTELHLVGRARHDVCHTSTAKRAHLAHGPFSQFRDFRRLRDKASPIDQNPPRRAAK